jgi:hypothetical protein
MRRLITTAAAFVGAAVLASAAVAATATPFGGATTSGGILTLVSNTGDAAATNDASGATFSDTGVTTFASITTLSAEFDVTDDDCKAGSPRFQIRVQTPSGEKNVFVYLGPAPSFTGCSSNVWIASGNLIGSPDSRFDTSQVQAGTQVSTHAQALALVGAFPVTGISLVVDSGWAFADKEQTVRVRNVKVNGLTFFQPEGPKPPSGGAAANPAKACLKARAEMGVESFRAFFGKNHTRANAFGKCVSYMARFRTGAAQENAVSRLDDAAERCSVRSTTGKGKGKGHGRAKGHGKAKGHAKQLAKCLEREV